MRVALAFRKTASEDRRDLRQWIEQSYPASAPGKPEATLFVLGTELGSENDEWPTAYAAATSAGRPRLGVLVAEATPPTADELEPALSGLVDTPWIHATEQRDELGAVVAELAPPPVIKTPDPRPSQLQRRPARDPALMRIATTSGGIGLLLLGTVGFGPASLFLFLSAVSFSISRLPEGEEG